MFEITLDDVDDLAAGATVLGTGGGADPYIPTLTLREALRRYGPVPVVRADELPPDGLVMPVAGGGAPTALLEKFFDGSENRSALAALEKRLGRTGVAVMPIELGGGNALFPVAAAAEVGLPVVDADTMRRAFPQIEMTQFTLAGIQASPLIFADSKGNVVTVDGIDNANVERFTRAVLVEMGMIGTGAAYPVTAQQVRDHAIQGSLSYCLELGRRVRAIAAGHPSAHAELLEFCAGRLVFTGKVADLDRRNEGGWVLGTATLEHLDDPNRVMRIDFQNENLVAVEDGVPVVTVPDLICLLDAETGQAMTTEILAYGQRLHVLATPAHERWRDLDGIELVGPRAFGYDIDYVPFDGGAR